MHKVQKILEVGDIVYSARDGEEMEVLSMGNIGFTTREDFFAYDEVTKLYFLTKRGYLEKLKEQHHG